MPQDVFDVAGKTLIVPLGTRGELLERQALTVSRCSKSRQDLRLESFPTFNNVLTGFNPSSISFNNLKDHVRQLDHLVPVIVHAHPLNFGKPVIFV